MTFGQKISTVTAALLAGAVLILVVVPGALYVLKLMNNGAGLEFPYIAWLALYFVYAVGIGISASDGSLFRKSKS